MNPANNRILDCGAGGSDPKLAFFDENGFDTYGIDISDDEIKKTETFCEKTGIILSVIKGDMRSIPFESKFFGYVYSYLSMVHLSKNGISIAINEIHRVLIDGGLCYLNFLSKDDVNFNEEEETKPGETIHKHGENEYFHSYFEDNEPNHYFRDFKIIYSEKRHIFKGKYHDTGRTCILDYIVKK